MLATIGAAQIQAFYETFQRDVNTFEDQLPNMLEWFPGEFVAILDGQIVDHNPDYITLVRSTKERFPKKFVFLERVLPKAEKVPIDMDTLEG